MYIYSREEYLHMTRVKFVLEISNFPLYVRPWFSHLTINKEGVCAGICVIIQKFVMELVVEEALKIIWKWMAEFELGWGRKETAQC